MLSDTVFGLSASFVDSNHVVKQYYLKNMSLARSLELESRPPFPVYNDSLRKPVLQSHIYFSNILIGLENYEPNLIRLCRYNYVQSMRPGRSSRLIHAINILWRTGSLASVEEPQVLRRI